MYLSSLKKEFCLYARVLVEVDLQVPLPTKVFVERKNLSFNSISGDNLPAFCVHCNTIGHFLGDCRLVKKV
ncbi:hypothetical protein LguiA_035685 [Lonicera macranthoides]